MGSHLSLVFLLLLHFAKTQSSLIYEQPFCSNRGVFSTNSAYNNNLKHMLSSLPSNVTATAGAFYNAMAGEGPDKVYALAVCMGDVDSKHCYACIDYAVEDATENCPNQKEVISWGNYECMLRYSNRDIFGSMEVDPSFLMSNPNNVTSDLDKFNRTLYGLVGSLIEKASSGSDVKFVAGSVSNSMYALVQCTPDISRNDCGVCLLGALDGVSNCCGRMEGGRFLSPGCFVWFELFKFYNDQFGGTYNVPISPPIQWNSTTEPPSKSPSTITGGNNSPANPDPNGKGSSTSRTVVFVIVPILVLVTLLAIGCTILLYKRTKKAAHDIDRSKSLESVHFELRTIKEATDDFSGANKLGQGGFGSVYKGRLPNGQEIGVKRIAGHSMQGEEQFMNEILLVAKLQHRNLVSFEVLLRSQ